MKNIDFEVIVKEKEGKYCLFVPKLSLYSENENLNIAYENILQQKKDLFSILEKRNFGDYVYDTERNIKNDLNKTILTFIVKYTSIALIIMVVFFLSVSFVSNKISQLSLVEFMKNQTKQVLTVIDTQLLELSDEEKQMRIDELSSFAREIKPYLQVFQEDNLIDNNTNSKK